MHARERRQMFGVMFGRSYFKSQPIGMNVMGIAIGFCILASVIFVAMAFASSNSGYVLALSPFLVVAREKAARCLNRAEDIRKKYKPEDTWASEDQTNFDTAMADFKVANNEFVVTQAREEQMAELDRQREYFTKPVDQVTIHQSGNPGSITIQEGFSRYLNHDESLPADMQKACVKIHKESLGAYLRGDIPGLQNYLQSQKLGAREAHALISGDNTLGGFLLYDDIRNEVIKAERGYAVLMPLCRNENTNSNALVMPKLKSHTADSRRTSGFAGKFQKEGYVTGGTAPTVQNQPTFERERIPVHSWQPDAVELGKELLEDSGANLEGLVADAIGECLAFDKDDKIFNGTGVNEPEGILQAGITQVASGGATSLVIGGFIGTFTEVPSQYRQRATWVMASRTMGAVLQLNTGTGGVYLFPPNQWNNTILGRPVVFLDYGMSTATAAGGTTFAAASKPVIFGDFSRYIIAQRQALAIQRLIERFAPNIGVLPTARFGGQVVLPDAFRIMKVSA
jgi:HK97 family phage major capsid protein